MEAKQYKLNQIDIKNIQIRNRDLRHLCSTQNINLKEKIVFLQLTANLYRIFKSKQNGRFEKYSKYKRQKKHLKQILKL